MREDRDLKESEKGVIGIVSDDLNYYCGGDLHRRPQSQLHKGRARDVS